MVLLPGRCVEVHTQSAPEVWVLKLKMLRANIEQEPVGLVRRFLGLRWPSPSPADSLLQRAARGLQVALAGLQTFENLLGVAEGGLGNINDILLTMRDLLVQASGDTVGTPERTAMGNQLAGLKAEIDRIAAKTTFNGTPLLDGTFVNGGGGGAPTPKRFQTGDSAGDFITFSFSQNFNTAHLGNAAANCGVVSAMFLDTEAKAQASLTSLDQYVTPLVTTQIQQIGSTAQRLRLIESNLSVAANNTTAAKSRLQDADIAQEQATATRLQLLRHLATAQLAQANLAPQSVLSLVR